jgi:hypothetical protein
MPKSRRKPITRVSADGLPIWPDKVEGGRLVEGLQRHVAQLRSEEHGNRKLFLDDVFVAYLLAFFNPTVRSLRTIEDFSQTHQAQKHLSTRRICKTTLSDFNKLADPERLQPIIAELRSALSRKFGPRPPTDIQGFLKQIVAVDGTFFTAAADVVWAIKKSNGHVEKRQARLDVQLDVRTWLPEVIAVPERGDGEAHIAAGCVQSGAIHLYDRGYGSFELIAAHYEEREKALVSRAEFVLRAQENQLLLAEDAESRALTAEEQARGFYSDRVGHFAGSQGRPAPPVLVREVRFRSETGEELRWLTNLLDVPVAAIAELYRHRWQIELFFRWLKCFANFDHLISHSRQGVLLNFYVVIVGVLLMYLHTGGRPSKYALALLSAVAQGGGTLENIMPILRERERQCEVARRSAALRRARKKAGRQ